MIVKSMFFAVVNIKIKHFSYVTSRSLDLSTKSLCRIPEDHKTSLITNLQVTQSYECHGQLSNYQLLKIFYHGLN